MNFLIIPFLIFPFFQVPIPFWGFYGHVLLNRQAVFSLPPEMLHLYKQELRFISEKAVNPDRRRYAVKGEAEKHYIDLDHYGDSALYKLPKYWAQAIEKFPEDSLRAHGIGRVDIEGFAFRFREVVIDRRAVKDGSLDELVFELGNSDPLVVDLRDICCRVQQIKTSVDQ